MNRLTMTLAFTVTAIGLLCAVAVGSAGLGLATVTGFAALTARGATFAKAGVGLGLVGLSWLLLGWRRPDTGTGTGKTPD